MYKKEKQPFAKNQVTLFSSLVKWWLMKWFTKSQKTQVLVIELAKECEIEVVPFVRMVQVLFY
jgi:hypothetical protein